MFKALLLSTTRKYRRMLISLALGIFGFQILMGSMYDAFAPMFQGGGLGTGAMPEALGAFTGGANMFEPVGWLGVGYAHPIPIVLIMAWSFVTSSNSVAREIEDGTAEWLLTRPLSRTLFLSTKILHFLFGFMVIASASLIGSLIGISLSDTLSEQITLVDIALMVVSYAPLAILTASLGFCISACTSQRSYATSAVLLFAVLSYTLHFAGQIWDTLGNVVHYSIFYQTVPANWAERDISGLAITAISTISAILIATAYLVFNRRNISN